MANGRRPSQLIWNTQCQVCTRWIVCRVLLPCLTRSASPRGQGRRRGQGASTTSHSDIRGLRRQVGAEPRDRSSSGVDAVLMRESGEAPVAKLRRVSSVSCLSPSVVSSF